MLRQTVERLRRHWPEITVFVRGNIGLVVPEMYDYCEAHGLFDAPSYATHKVLKRRVRELELKENTRWRRPVAASAAG